MDTVSLSIPASPEQLRLVRLVAAGLASRLNFTIDDIEDLKIGVDELCTYLIGAGGPQGHLHIVFAVGAAHLEITGRAELAPSERVRTELTELSQMILNTVADRAELRPMQGALGFFLSKGRSVAPDPASRA